MPSKKQDELERYITEVLDPSMDMVRESIIQTGVNPLVLPRIVRALANLAYGTGFGKIQIFMQHGKVTQIKPEESDQIEMKVLVKF